MLESMNATFAPALAPFLTSRWARYFIHELALVSLEILLTISISSNLFLDRQLIAMRGCKVLAQLRRMISALILNQPMRTQPLKHQNLTLCFLIKPYLPLTGRMA